MPIAHINHHDMYYEVLGKGEPILCMGGWGTFCHDNHHHLARGLTDRYQVIIFDYRGIGDSTDDLSVPSTMALHAEDAIGLLDHLGLKNVHLVGLVGMGACVAQEIAIRRPDLARSMLIPVRGAKSIFSFGASSRCFGISIATRASPPFRNS